jgi:hypothetical protein
LEFFPHGNYITGGPLEFLASAKNFSGGKRVKLACANYINGSRLEFLAFAKTFSGGRRVKLACANCINGGRLEFLAFAKNSNGGKGQHLPKVFHPIGNRTAKP